MDKEAQSYFVKNNWDLFEKNTKVRKVFKFKTFKEAFSWMTEIALSAEKLDHHPDWTNIYNRVIVILSTHDVGKITKKDILLARFMDEIVDRYK